MKIDPEKFLTEDIIKKAHEASCIEFNSVFYPTSISMIEKALKAAVVAYNTLIEPNKE